MLDLELTLQSGQAFLWKRRGNTFYIINGCDIMIVSEDLRYFASYNGNSMTRFFRLDDDMDEIYASINKDRVIGEAISRFKGLRILRQDPFQTLISFICSSNTSINNIKRMLTNIIDRFGEEVEWTDQHFKLFPTPDRIANADINELIRCGLGFRASYVKEASKAIASNMELDRLVYMEYDEARNALMRLKGVGMKVADCVLLFGLEHLEAFPIDRWIWRILSSYNVDGSYRVASEIMRSYFGKYAGYAQQYLYCYARMFY